MIGIAASRLSEEFHLPTIMICCDGERGKGSCRSFGGFNLYNALSACSEYLEGFGGHALAAGLTIRRENIDRFRRALGEYYRQNPADDLPELTCDLRVNDPHLLTMPCIESLDALEPCGNGNPKPLLCITGARLVNAVPIGGGRHLRLHFAKGGYNYAGIFFSCTPAQLGVRIGQWVDVAFTPQINEYRSVRSVQLNLVDIRPDKAFREAQGHDRAVYKKHLAGGELSCDEAECLLPTRQDFVAVWRYLAAFSQGGVLSEELGCLSRKISRCAKLSLSAGKTRICLDVLAEQGLLQLEQRPKSLCIRLCADGRKVDLEKSPILIHLKKQKAGT